MDQNLINPTLAPDLLKKQYELAQSQRYAQMLMEQGSETPQGQMVSGHYVAPSITQYLAQALKSGLGGSIARGVPRQMADASQAQRDSVYAQFGLGGGAGQPTAGAQSGASPQALGQALASGGQSMMPAIPGMSREQQALIASTIGMPEYLKIAANKGGPVNVAPGGTLYNPQTGRPDYIAPQDGVMMQDGQAVAVPGYQDIRAGQAGAVAGAQEKARADLDLVSVPMPDGGTQQMTRSQAAARVSDNQSGAQGADAPGYVPPKEVIEARRDLPRVTDDVAVSLSLLDKLESHPGFSDIIGARVPGAALVWGSNAAGADAILKQIGGRAFLQAFESLKGGGQITEIEGQKATEAVARLSTAQSEKDFKIAMDDLRDVLQNGVRRAYQSARMEPPNPFGAPSQPQEQQVAQPASRAEYDALPSGSTFRAPDGSIRRKP